MNEDDLKTTKVKEKKAKKATKTEVKAETSEVKTEKKAKKKAAPKAETVIEVVAEPKAKAKKTKDAAEPKAKKVIVEAKAEEVVEAKPKTAKKAKAETIEAKAEPKAKKLSAKKAAVAEVLPKQTEETEPETASFVLPLASKIQTQENFDLTETLVENEELSPVFKELAEPKLPALREENRAYLQMQSPTRVFFYWSLKQDSYNTLSKALGNRAKDYFLAIRLVNLNTNQDEIHQVGNKGSWWFNNIQSDSKYRAEVGFYAHNRPFVRIVFSNTLETPRLKPSANTDYQPYFAVSSDQFAEVLDLAGFSQDAFDVYIAGDEPGFADEATEKAFVQLSGKGQIDFSNISLNELRYVLFALASGISLFALRENVSADLFEFLSALVDENPEALTEEKVILALEEFFEFSPFEEELEEEIIAPTVFGASLINFPKKLRKKKSGFNPDKLKEGKLSPLSSFSLK